MYCTHYKFSEKPFDVTPNPRFLYMTEGHRETLASLIYGIIERRGFITIVGEAGTGKTTLLNTALDRLDEKTRVAYIFNTDLTFNQILVSALYEWGLVKPKEKLSIVKAVQRLNNFAINQMAKGGNVVLIVDEAQNLDNRVMENLRLLSNLETRRHKLVQIVLSGQPELDTKLRQHELRQFAQRISLRRHITPLDEKDTYAYLKHRLKIANYSGSSLFTTEAQKLIWDYSGGIPRKINMLCDNALLIGYGLKKKKINSAIVQEAAQDLKWNRFEDLKALLDFPPAETTTFTRVEDNPPRQPLKLSAAMIIAGLLIITSSFYLAHTGFQFTGITHFFSKINDVTLKAIQHTHKKQQTESTVANTPVQAIVLDKVISPNSTREDAEPKIRADSEVNGTALNLIQTKPMNQAKLLQLRNLAAQPISVNKTFSEDLPEQRAGVRIHIMELKRSDLTVPIKKEEQKILYLLNKKSKK